LNKWDAQVDGFASKTQLAVEQKNGGICHGDSGGPLYASVNGKIQLVAVTNAFAHKKSDPTAGKDDCQGFGIYTSTAAMKTWIENAKQTLSGSASPVRSLAQASN
jgi:secreted trypsin-like serine protease